MNPKNQTSKPPVQQHQYQSNVDEDQTVPFARMQKKTGMVNIKKQFLQTNKNIKTLDTQQKNTQDPSVHSRISDTTKPPAHLDAILQYTGQICGANLSKKRVGGEDEKAQQKIWTRLFFRLRVRLRVR